MTDRAWREMHDEPLLFRSPWYQVIGAAPVLDHEPGEEFQADIPPEREAFYLANGHLRRLPKEFGPRLPRLDESTPSDGAGADDPPTPPKE